MKADRTATGAMTDREGLPEMFPTHRHDPRFWEHLGRAVASFGFLEDVLKKAYFALTGTTPVAPEDAKKAVKKWGDDLERVMTKPLKYLAKDFGVAANAHPNTSKEHIGDLVADIENAADLRNVLCHGSWMVPDEEGKSLPRFSKRDQVTGKVIQFSDKIDTEYLSQVQAHVADLICSVVDTVTQVGYQFPGSSGPGKPIW